MRFPREITEFVTNWNNIHEKALKTLYSTSGKIQLKKTFLSKTPSIQDESMKINMTNASYPDYCSSTPSITVPTTREHLHVGSAYIGRSFHGSDSNRGTSFRMPFKFVLLLLTVSWLLEILFIGIIIRPNRSEKYVDKITFFAPWVCHIEDGIEFITWSASNKMRQ